MNMYRWEAMCIKQHIAFFIILLRKTGNPRVLKQNKKNRRVETMRYSEGVIEEVRKVLGFGGRVLGEGKPKYLNSPESLVFDKSRNLFGINYAKNSRAGYFILCEGYMDVIAMHQAGFDMTVK